MSAEEKENLLPSSNPFDEEYGSSPPTEEQKTPENDADSGNKSQKSCWEKFCIVLWGIKACKEIGNLRAYELILLIILTIYPLLVGIIEGALFASSSYRDQVLIQPSWAPPPALFPAVWTFLYLMMGLASFLVLKQGGGFCLENVIPLILYALQLGANFAWTPVFFGKGELAAGLLIIAVLWGLLLATILTFIPRSWPAALLMLPYLAWVSFATALNYSIVVLNGPYLVTNAETTVAPAVDFSFGSEH